MQATWNTRGRAQTIWTVVASIAGFAAFVGLAAVVDRPPSGTAPTTTATAGSSAALLVYGGDPVAGKSIFLTSGCSACHTLHAASATGTVGPNLDVYLPPLSLIRERITSGSGVMPPFRDRLSAQQIKDVAAFVFANE